MLYILTMCTLLLKYIFMKTVLIGLRISLFLLALIFIGKSIISFDIYYCVIGALVLYITQWNELWELEE